jgi:hypothetical protein
MILVRAKTDHVARMILLRTLILKETTLMMSILMTIQMVVTLTTLIEIQRST